MRVIIGLVLLAATAWSGWWVFGSQAQEKALNAWIADRNNAGWDVAISNIAVKGFPNRFDTRLEELNISTGDWGWSAPDFTILMLSYKPNHIIVSFPTDHELATPDGPLSMTNNQLRASIIFAAENALPLDEFRLEGTQLNLQATDWELKADTLNIAVQAVEDTPSDYRIFVGGNSIKPPRHWHSVTGIEDDISVVNMDATLTTNLPIDRHLINSKSVRPENLQIHSATIEWGDLAVTADGKLALDANGVLDGEIAVHADDWQSIYAVLLATGIARVEDAEKWQSGLKLATALNVGRGVTLTFTVRNGLIFLGPVPLGPAPMIQMFN